MDYWQITIDELLEPSRKPKTYFTPMPGCTGYCCGICREAVGLYSNGTTHDEGWLYKRETCRNGHEIDWSETE